MKKYLAKIVVAILLITQLAAPVYACEEAPLTQGYWKNHVSKWIPDLQNCAFEYYNDGKFEAYYYQDVLKTPTGGDPWYILAHQYIAFKLNIFNGAYSYCSNEATLKYAETFLNYGPGNIPKDLRASAIELAEMLDGLNNGTVLD